MGVKPPKAGSLTNRDLPTEPEELLSLCELVGWKVEKSQSGFKVMNSFGISTVLSRSGNGRRSDNARRALISMGLGAAVDRYHQAEEKRRQHGMKASEKASTRAGERAAAAAAAAAVAPTSSAPPAVFQPPQTTFPAPKKPPTTPKTAAAEAKTSVADPAGDNDDMYTKFEDVTPTMAMDWMTTPAPTFEDGSQLKQRALRPPHVEWLAGQILNGDFETTHQGIALSREGFVLDGQHRLQAIIDTGRTVRLQVTYNVPKRLFDRFDVGKKRTPGDVFTMAGISGGTSAAGAAKMYHIVTLWTADPKGRLKNWNNWDREQVSAHTQAQVAAENPILSDLVYEFSALGRGSRRINIGAAVAFLVWIRDLYSDEAMERAKAYLRPVKDQEGTTRSDIEYHVGEWFANAFYAGTAFRGASRVVQLLALVKGWNIRQSGRQVGCLLKGTDLMPIPLEPANL